MKPITALFLFALIALIITLGVLVGRGNKYTRERASYDSLEQAVKASNIILDSLYKREALIIHQHQHNTKKYYENHYTILAANDSATQSLLRANIARFEYLHYITPSKDH